MISFLFHFIWCDLICLICCRAPARRGRSGVTLVMEATNLVMHALAHMKDLSRFPDRVERLHAMCARRAAREMWPSQRARSRNALRFALRHGCSLGALVACVAPHHHHKSTTVRCLFVFEPIARRVLAFCAPASGGVWRVGIVFACRVLGGPGVRLCLLMLVFDVIRFRLSPGQGG